MNGRNHPQLSGAQRPGRWLALLMVAVVLAGCGGGGGGNGGSNGGGGGGAGQPAPAPGGAVPGGPAAEPLPPDPGEPAASIDVGGPGLGTPGPGPERSFGEVAVGSSGAPQRFELRNTLEYTVTVVGLTVEGDGSFGLTENRCAGATLPPRDGACAFAVAFTPNHEGAALAGLRAQMTLTCTDTAHHPCDQDPQWGEGQGKNFTRVELPSGQAAFTWTSLAGRFTGSGTATPTTS
jgi:hypothetical protein